MPAATTLAGARSLLDSFLADNIIDADELNDIFNTFYNLLEQNDTESLSIGWASIEEYDTKATADSSGNPYLTESGDRFWKSKVDANINHQPPSDPSTTEDTYWIEVSKAEANPFSELTPGVYGAGLIIGYFDNQILKLTVAARPYESEDIAAEIIAGDWEVIRGKVHDEDDMASDDPDLPPSQQSVKAFVEGITGLLSSLNTTDKDSLVNAINENKTLISGIVGGIAATYLDITTLFAEQGNQVSGAMYEVTNASGDATVDEGTAWYKYLGTTFGNITDYKKISEEEAFNENNQPIVSTSNTLLFDKKYRHGSWTTPITGNLVLEDTGAKDGVVSTVIWSGDSNPAITGGVVQQISGNILGQNTYTIYIQYLNGRYNVNIFNVDGIPNAIIPDLISITIENDNPNGVVMVFSEAVTGTNLGFTLAGSTSTVFTSITGFGTNTLTGVLSDGVVFGETVTLSYDALVGDIINATLQPLTTIVTRAVTNNVDAIQTLLYENDFSVDTGLLVTTSEGSTRTMEIDADGAQLRVLANATTMYAELQMSGLAGYAVGKNYKLEIDWINYTHSNTGIPVRVFYPNLSTPVGNTFISTDSFPVLSEEYLFTTDVSGSKLFISATGTGNVIGDLWKIDNLKIYEVL